jgi:hypothetical protein
MMLSVLDHRSLSSSRPPPKHHLAGYPGTNIPCRPWQTYTLPYPYGIYHKCAVARPNGVNDQSAKAETSATAPPEALVLVNDSVAPPVPASKPAESTDWDIVPEGVDEWPGTKPFTWRSIDWGE